MASNILEIARLGVGQQYDVATALDYLNARYYNGSQGQFLSEDPVFLAIGSQKLNQLANGKLSEILTDPSQDGGSTP
jgi:RHS repeat-associated protein